MGITIEIEIIKTAWTEVAASGSGFISNEGTTPVKVRIATSLPTIDDTIGHTLGYSRLGQLDRIGYNLLSGEKVYAVSITADTAKLTVTPNE